MVGGKSGLVVNNRRQGVLFIVSGPSGVGKTTLVEAFLKKNQKEMAVSRVVTYTTREPRSYEIDGQDYHFINKEEFLDKREQGFFLEWNSWGDNYYGMPKEFLKDIKAGRSFIIVLDRQGVKKVLKELGDEIEVVSVWLFVADIKVLEKRLKKRASETQEIIAKRVKISRLELMEEESNPLCQYRIKSASLKHSLGELEGLAGLYIPAEI